MDAGTTVVQGKTGKIVVGFIALNNKQRQWVIKWFCLRMLSKSARQN